MLKADISLVNKLLNWQVTEAKEACSELRKSLKIISFQPTAENVSSYKAFH